ncbi:MAG: AraC family transcriptional regulator, partial [Lachnospiraceae bacterium]|nr:AraC family transcriptional regulator [Lachnospiraceae bacterium]
LINIFRRLAPKDNTHFVPSPSRINTKNGDMTRMRQVVQYLNKHVRDRLTVSDICRDNMIGKSQLQRLFHMYEGCGVIEYFSRLKIDTAKIMIRENRYSFTEISNILNYSSYQYFSLQFKKYTRMSPSEYSSSTKVFTEGTLDMPAPAAV